MTWWDNPSVSITDSGPEETYMGRRKRLLHDKICLTRNAKLYRYWFKVKGDELYLDKAEECLFKAAKIEIEPLQYGCGGYFGDAQALTYRDLLETRKKIKMRPFEVKLPKEELDLTYGVSPIRISVMDDLVNRATGITFMGGDEPKKPDTFIQKIKKAWRRFVS